MESIERPTKNWLRWHISTWCIVASVFVLLSLIAIPGERFRMPMGIEGDFFQHGWPLPYLRRVVIANSEVSKLSASTKSELIKTIQFDSESTHERELLADAPYWSRLSNWSWSATTLANTPGRAVRFDALILNITLMIVVLVIFGKLIERRRQFKPHFTQSSLAEWLIAIAVLVVIFVLLRDRLEQAHYENGPAKEKLLSGVTTLTYEDKTPTWLRKLSNNNRLLCFKDPTDRDSAAPKRIPIGRRITGIEFNNSLPFIRDIDEYVATVDSLPHLESVSHWMGSNRSLFVLGKMRPDSIRELSIYSFQHGNRFQFLKRF